MGMMLNWNQIYTSGLRDVGLQDKYDLNKSTVFVSGTQALVRLCLLQAEKDRAAGLNTAGYVTGYRGSPLGGIDLQFSQAEPALTAAGVTFHPGLNEDLAATAVWGTQQINLHGEGTKGRGVCDLVWQRPRRWTVPVMCSGMAIWPGHQNMAGCWC